MIESIDFQNPLVRLSSALLVVFVCIFVFDRLFKFFLGRLLRSDFKTRHRWLGAFTADSKLVTSVSWLFYLVFIHQILKWIPYLPLAVSEVSQRVIVAGFIVTVLMICSHVSRIINSLYSSMEISRSRPIKGYLQSALIIVYFMGFICILSVLLDKSPLIFLSGLGALTAVLLLVFKDSILSLVAGIQLTMNDLIRVGDWLEMPQFNADGSVIEIALHSVKVQNWDQTITVIPAHKFLENSFKNWRGMQEAGGRRIKRSVIVDINTIRFLSDSDIQHLSQIRLLSGYLSAKTVDVRDYNGRLPATDSQVASNKRRLTNVGTFRAYITEYLKSHPLIHKNMTFLVRQLAPDAEGLPIEIYVFTNDTRWAVYEGAQADIFDHLLAIMPEFGLRFFQKPSGRDLESRLAIEERAFDLREVESNIAKRLE